MAKARTNDKPTGRLADTKKPTKDEGSTRPPAKAAVPAKAAAPTKTAEPVKAAAPAKAAPPSKVASPAKASEPVKAASPSKAASPAKSASAVSGPLAKAIPDVSQVRAHPDAKLTKAEMQSLFGKLVEERSRMLATFDRHLSGALEDEDLLADEIDIAQRASEQASLFRMADKDRKLLIEIEAALGKMRAGEYGLCEGTDEPIGFKRLELRPWTRYSVSYKELLEHEKAQHSR
jgi:DnaK suppressor protein